VKVRIKIDGREHEMSRCFRAVHILAMAGLDGTYRIFEDRDGLLSKQLHHDEWVIPDPGDKFVCIPYASGGPGGGDDRRVKMISAAFAEERGDDEAWARFEESDRWDD